jgi:hypothetical protein
MCKSQILARVYPALKLMASLVNEIDWGSRLNLFNHVEHFPHCLTGFVDTFPLVVQEPRHCSQGLFNGKYKYVFLPHILTFLVLVLLSICLQLIVLEE